MSITYLSSVTLTHLGDVDAKTVEWVAKGKSRSVGVDLDLNKNKPSKATHNTLREVYYVDFNRLLEGFQL